MTHAPGTTAAPDAPATGRPVMTKTARLRYHGEGGSLFGLMLVNSILTACTLGIYSFWARTKVRAFHYSNTEFDGDRFAWHGTGSELLKGGVLAGAFLMVLALVYNVVLVLIDGQNASPMAQAALTLGVYGVIGVLIPIAINGARRYRLSRSSWRGIRFSFHGPASQYMWLVLGGGIATALTLGFMGPYFENRRREFFVTHARFGSEPFLYDGDGRELFRDFVKAWLLTIPTLGISWVGYMAAKHRYFWKHTALRGARFHSTVTTGALIGLHFTNFLLAIVTLGLASPWIITRTQEFWCDNLVLHGTVDWAAIHQQAQVANATAEGLADGLDLDVGIGM